MIQLGGRPLALCEWSQGNFTLGISPNRRLRGGKLMKRYVPVCFLLMLVFQLSTGLAFADRADDCQKLVDKAVDFTKENGPEYSLKVFSASKGPFIDKELYVFACSMDNVMLAHPYKSELIGKNVDDFQDVKGDLLFQEFKKVAQNGGRGWVHYWWWRPGEKDAFPKSSFIMKVPGENLYVGAGYYATPAHASR
jgi:cytochrome c